MGSEETGVGPFQGNVFRFVIRDGQIIEAGNEHPHHTNGMIDYVPVVTDWVLAHASPAERRIHRRRQSALPATDRAQWMGLWSQGIDAYVAAHPSEGNG